MLKDWRREDAEGKKTGCPHNDVTVAAVEEEDGYPTLGEEEQEV